MLPLLSAIAMHCLQLNSALMLVLLVPCCQEATDEVLWGWSGAHQGCTTLPQTKYRATPHGKYAKKLWTKCLSFGQHCVCTCTYWVSEWTCTSICVKHMDGTGCTTECVCVCVCVWTHVDLCIWWDRAACVAAWASVCVSVGVGILRKHLPPSFFECTRGTLETWCNFIETWKFVLGNFDFQN